MMYLDERDEILNTSYARAIQHCLLEAEQGHSAAHVISSTGIEWRSKRPTWGDAVMALSHKLRTAPDTVPPIQPTLAKICLRCHSRYETVSKDDKVCTSCSQVSAHVVVPLRVGET